MSDSQKVNAPSPEPLIHNPWRLEEREVVTPARLRSDLHDLGIVSGTAVCVHSSLKRMGHVIGGLRTVVQSLVDTVGSAGTILMPTFSGDLSDPKEWRYPGLPDHLVDEARHSLKGYNPRLTPTRGMGALPEYFRHWPGAVRSPHPQSSFTALGAHADLLCERHPLDYRFGPDSPLGRFVGLGGKVLLLGAPWNTTSLLYLTEFTRPDRVECLKQAPVERNGETRWETYRDLEYRNCWHDAVAHLLEEGLAVRGRVGEAESVLFPAREAVEAISLWRRKSNQ
jgi:aminoglycoside 3-N-acetyltransferase